MTRKHKQLSVEQHYRPAEAAKLIGLARSTIYTAINEGQLTPIVKHGHSSVLIPASTLQRYLDQRRVG